MEIGIWGPAARLSRAAPKVMRRLETIVMSLHIFTEQMQPAMHWTDVHGQEPVEFIWPANRLLWCECCHQKRPAKNCVVQSYYDGLYVWCAAGKGCKDPRVIAAKRRREFQRRRAGQKRRFALRHNAQAQPRFAKGKTSAEAPCWATTKGETK